MNGDDNIFCIILEAYVPTLKTQIKNDVNVLRCSKFWNLF